MNSCLEAKTAQGVLVSSLEAGPHHDLKVSNSKIVYISSICFQQTTKTSDQHIRTTRYDVNLTMRYDVNLTMRYDVPCLN